MLHWERDEEYTDEETARAGRYAIVIAPPYYTDDGWGFLIYDEDDEKRMEYGETIARGEGFKDANAVKMFFETIAEGAAK